MARSRISDWEDITVNNKAPFSDAITILSKGGYQLCLVVDKKNFLVGIITDSDIRKGLIKGLSLKCSIGEIMNKKPLVVSTLLSDEEAQNTMRLNHIFHLPIVNSAGILIGLHVADFLYTSTEKPEIMVIMAGGKGKRLLPLTENVPKPMLPIKGKPILEHIINRSKMDGFKKIFISVNYLSEIIEKHFGNGERFGVSIEYLREDKPLGTAGSLKQLPKEYLNRNILVTNGDVITNASYSDFLSASKSQKCDGLMAVLTQKWNNPFAVVETQGSKIISLKEKPIVRSQINAGIYVLSPKMINLIRKNEYCDMPDLFINAIRNKLELKVYPLHESWIDIGRPEDYKYLCEKEAILDE